MVARTAVKKEIPIEILINQHCELKAQAASAAAAELALRNLISQRLFGGKLKEGANSYKLADGRTVVLTGKINRNIDVEAMDANWEKLPPGVYEEVIRWKADLAVGAFKLAMANPSTAMVLSEFVTESPGTPGYELKPAKDKKK